MLRGAQYNDEVAGGTLVISRKSPSDIKIRDLYILLDGSEVGNVPYDTSITLPVAEGNHTLAATNRLYTRTASFTVGPSERVDFEAENVASGCGSLMFIIVGMGPYKVRLRKL